MTGQSPVIAAPVAAMLGADRSLDGPGIEMLEAAEGHARAVLAIRPDHVNGHARVHGGLVFMLADTALAGAANSVVAPAVTAGADVVFFGSAGVGDVLVADARMRSTQGRTSVLDVTVRCEERVVAEVRGRAVQLRSSDDRPTTDRVPL